MAKLKGNIKVSPLYRRGDNDTRLSRKLRKEQKDLANEFSMREAILNSPVLKGLLILFISLIVIIAIQ